MADYYEKLYGKKNIRTHEHHEKVIKELKVFKEDVTNEDHWYNEIPTIEELREVISNKKNGKASTDIRNELIKRTEDEFATSFLPLVHEIWKNEKIPQVWNEGSITTIWKGKGDKENLANHRGITVSSAIGSIIEEVIDQRIEKVIQLTQGQAGGVKGATTADHLFLLRAIMTIAKENKWNLFLTFYDVQKAYDRADVDNMLHIAWKAGIKGKLWRILKELSTNLTAVVKTRFGPS